MSIARKLRREKQIQARKALRQELKDGAVQEHIKKQVHDALLKGYDHGYELGKLEVAEAAFGLSYDG